MEQTDGRRKAGELSVVSYALPPWGAENFPHSVLDALSSSSVEICVFPRNGFVCAGWVYFLFPVGFWECGSRAVAAPPLNATPDPSHATRRCVSEINR